jgi:hypothetical protein
MRRFIIAVFVLTVCFLTIAATAQNPHFVTSNGSVQSDGTLLVTWKEAGLGNGQVIAYSGTAYATAVWGCINPGGHHPKASNKETVSGPVGASGSFTAGKNGSINGALIMGPPPPTPDFICPKGQVLVLGSITYTNVGVEDENNNIYEDFAGPYSRVFYPW